MDPLGAHDPERIGLYRLLGRLGAGGMGQVFLGEDRRGELVAVKVVHPGFAHDERFRLRFRREVEISRQVTGPWVAAVVDADPDASTPWLATEYVRGPSLGAAVQSHGPLSPAAVHALAHGLAIALAAVHAGGLVHRDLKPSNVLLGADHPRLIDFGISRAIDATQVTSTGVIVGTPAFMSPEQIAGEDVGPASDVFSLGSVLAFAATGRSPFGDHQPLPLMMRISGHEPDLDGVPDVLRGPIAACLAKRPADRPTAAELGGMLGAVVADGPGWLQAEATAIGADPVVPTVLPAPTKVATEHPVPVDPPQLNRRALLGVVGAIGLLGAGGAALAAAYGPAPATRLTPPVTVEAPEPRLRWTASIPHWAGPLYATADDDTVYSYTGEDAAVVIALDSGTGVERWRVPGWTPDVKSYYQVNMIPAGDVLLIGTDTVMAALDAGTGRRLWEIPRSASFHEPIATADGVVLGATDDGLVALDVMSGGRIWGSDSDELPVNVVADHGVCISGMSRRIEARDLRTGQFLWSHDTGQWGGPSLVAVDGLVAAGYGNSVVVLESTTGQQRWNTPSLAPFDSPGALVVVGNVLVALAAGGTALHGLDLVSGTRRWTLPESGQTQQNGWVAADGFVYVKIDNGPTCAYDVVSGTPRWAVGESPDYFVPFAARGSDAYLFTLAPGRIQAVSIP